MTNFQDTLRDDPWADFYNLDGAKTFSLTTDIDWAPDYAVEDLLSLVETAGLPLTAFATHKSSLLSRPPDWLEVGLHPDNTRPDPVYGLSRKILDLKEMYPQAVGVRAHRNFFGQNTAQLASQANLAYDASVFLWQRPWCQIHKDQYGLVRMCYNWEDGVQADMGLDWSLNHVPIQGPGLKIFNVHPIFIYLNCPNDDYRRSVVSEWKNLQDAPVSALKSKIFQGYGARSFLIDLLAHLKKAGMQAVRLDAMAAAGNIKKETK
jgi:hypothetical protein